MPLSRIVCHPYTKFEVPTFTQYEDMKGNEKCRNCEVRRVRSHPLSQAMSPFDRVHTTLTDTMHLSCTIFDL